MHHAPAASVALANILRFLAEIGLEVRRAPLPQNTFVPGIFIDHGELVIDEERLLYPGDLLHEAGHLAIMPPDRRPQATGDVTQEMGDEIATQAWSYAASLSADVPLDVLFHDEGYRGSAAWLRELFSNGGTVGVPLLAWFGMTTMPGRETAPEAIVYPRMSTWLRTTPHPPQGEAESL